MVQQNGYNGTDDGSYAGVEGTKSPTGDRHVPAVAKSELPPVSAQSPVKTPIRHTPMPAPKQRWGERGGGKSHGGN